MIFKSYLVEENINLLKNKIVLFYGENIGLLEDFKDKIKLKYNKSEIISLRQEEVLKNLESFQNEIMNMSLFNKSKIILIQEVSDKIAEIISEISLENKEIRIFLFSNILDKKSKLRNNFEKSKNADIIACYKDNEITIKKIISKKLQNYKGITNEIIETISGNCSYDRSKLNKELDKIKIYFSNKVVNLNDILKLLDPKLDDDFNIIKNSALNGQKTSTNKLLSSSLIEIEKIVLYLSLLNKRLEILKEISEKSKTSLDIAVNQIKPPIFWKEKPFFLIQAKLWNKEKINKALKVIYDTEVKTKTNSDLNKKILLKKLLVDICNLANAA